MALALSLPPHQLETAGVAGGSLSCEGGDFYLFLVLKSPWLLLLWHCLDFARDPGIWGCVKLEWLGYTWKVGCSHPLYLLWFPPWLDPVLCNVCAHLFFLDLSISPLRSNIYQEIVKKSALTWAF